MITKYEFSNKQIVILLEGLSQIMDSDDYPKEAKEIAEECLDIIEKDNMNGYYGLSIQ